MTLCSEAAWVRPRNRVLQRSAAMRHLTIGEADDPEFAANAIDPVRVFGMADAWALRQGKFREDDIPGLG